MDMYSLHTLNPALQFTYNPYVWSTIVAFILNSILIVVILRQKFKTVTHYFAVFINFSVAIWALFESLMRLSTTAVGASYWISLSSVGWLFGPPSVLGFCLAYTGKEKFLKNFLSEILLFGPSFIFMMISLTTDLVDSRNFSLYKKEYFGWADPVAPIFIYIIAPWIIILTGTALILLFKHWRKTEDKQTRNQTLALILGLLIPFAATFFTEIVFPIGGLQQFAKMGVMFTAFGCVIFTFGIIRYKLFIINPATVATNIVDTMNEILLVFNAQTYAIEYTNSAIYTVLGYHKDQLIGKNINTLISSHWPDFYQKIIHVVEEGHDVKSIETDLLSAKGEKVPVNFAATPYRGPDGKIMSIVSIATDLRELKELLNVAAERSKLNVTMESISDGVLALDIDGRVTVINSAALQMLRITTGEIIGQRLDELFTLMDQDARVHTIDLLPQGPVTEEHVTLYKKELQISRPGLTLYASIISSTIKSGESFGLGAIITLHDLSAEKQLEEMKLDFVSMAAHELRTPLTSLRGYTYILTREYNKTFDEYETTIVNRINISIQRLTGLVENLLNVTRIERGTLTTHLETIDWIKNINEIIGELIDQAKDKKISLKFIPPHTKPPLVPVDKMRINEVITNLLANAINYTPPGGSVSIWIEQTPKEIITHVKDTGEGIPPEALPHLFTKFFRVSGKLEQGSKGTGLGLYISKSIIEMHKGRIWAESEGLGKGATFSFTIPIIQTTTSSPMSTVNTIKN